MNDDLTPEIANLTELLLCLVSPETYSHQAINVLRSTLLGSQPMDVAMSVVELAERLNFRECARTLRKINDETTAEREVH